MEVDGKDVMPDVFGVLDKIKGFSDQVKLSLSLLCQTST